MSRELRCADCKTLMAEVRDARMRPDLIAYCARCDTKNQEMMALPRKDDIPDFLLGLMRGRK